MTATHAMPSSTKHDPTAGRVSSGAYPVPAYGPQRVIRRVTAIIVTYQSRRHLPSLLESLRGSTTELSLDTVVVDNGSTDGTVDFLMNMPDIRLIKAPGNIGYAAAINIGREAVPSDVDAIAILNPDLKISRRSLDVLSQALRDPDVGVAVPRIVQPDGSLFHSLRREPSLVSALGDAVFGHFWSGRPGSWSDTVWAPRAYESGHSVDWASGAAWLVAQDCDAATGPWDERFFLYSEETDYARRVRANGFRIEYVPDSTVTHVGGGSGRSTQLDALMAVNRLKDYGTVHSRPSSLAYTCVTMLHHAARSTSRAHREVLLTLLSKRRRQLLPGPTIAAGTSAGI